MGQPVGARHDLVLGLETIQVLLLLRCELLLATEEQRRCLPGGGNDRRVGMHRTGRRTTCGSARLRATQLREAAPHLGDVGGGAPFAALFVALCAVAAAFLP